MHDSNTMKVFGRISSCTFRSMTKPQHYIWLMVVILFAFSQLAFLIHPFKFDMINYHYPWRFFIAECLRNGVLPFWNPYHYMGSPIHADPQSGVFYFPLYLLALVQRYDFFSLATEFILHLFIAGLGIYKLGQRFRLSSYASLFMALAYSLSGFMCGHTAHLSWIISAAWLPWVFLGFYDVYASPNFRNAVKFALIGFLFNTGGYPAFAIITLYIILGILIFIFGKALWRKNCKQLKPFVVYLSLSLFFTLILQSPYLISVYQVLPFLDRSTGVLAPEANALPFHPLAILSFFFPFSMVSNNYFELTEVIPTDLSLANAYIGLLSIVFLFAGINKAERLKPVILLWLAFVFFLLVSFGESTPLRSWLYEYLPGMKLFRFAGLFRLFAIMAAILIAGLQFDNFLVSPDIYRNRVMRFCLILGASLMVFVLYSASRSNIFESWRVSSGFRDFFLKQGFFNRIILQGSFQFLIIALMIIVFSLSKIGSPKTIAKGIILILSIDLITATQLNAPFTSYMQSSGVNEPQRFIENIADGFPLPLEKPMKEKSHTDATFKPFNYNFNVLQKELVPDGYSSFGLKSYFAFFYGDSLIKNQTLSHPWYFIQSNDSSSDSIQRARLLNFTPGTFEFECSSTKESQLVVLQNYFPNWSVSVNGEKQKPEIFKGSFMAVNLKPGENKVRFYYHSTLVNIMFFISLATFVLFLLFIVFGGLLKTKSSRACLSDI